MELPLIKLEIESMKHSILHHFGLYQAQLSDAVAAEIERVIGEYDYQGAVTKAAIEVLNGTIESFFRYGEGREIIQSAMNEALKKVFKPDKPIRPTEGG